MSKDFLLTEKEINDTLLHSPYVMPSSPYERGQGAEQVKKYFYEFIRFFANILNLHLAKIEIEADRLSSSLEGKQEIVELHNSSSTAHELIFQELREQILSACESLNSHNQDENAHSSLGTRIESDISAHNQDENAHASLGAKIDNAISAHEQDEDAHSALIGKLAEAITAHSSDADAHSDMRTLISEVLEEAQCAYNLAVGKSKIIPFANPKQMLDYLDQNQAFVGDVFIFEEENVPDFTYFGEISSSSGMITINYTDYVMGYIKLTPGKSYYYKGKKLVASESGLDVSTLATSEDLSMVSFVIGNGLNDLSSRVTALEEGLLSYAKKKSYVTSTTGAITLKTNTIYDLGELASLTITLPSSVLKDFNACVNFRSGLTATQLSCDSGIYFSGDDCANGVLTPVAKRLYQIDIKRPSSKVVASVIAIDCEVG